MDNGKVFLGVLAGLTTGVVLGILFAPNKGSETRRKIVKQKEDLTDGMKDLFNDFAETMSDKCEKVKESVSEAKHANTTK